MRFILDAVAPRMIEQNPRLQPHSMNQVLEYEQTVRWRTFRKGVEYLATGARRSDAGIGLVDDEVQEVLNNVATLDKEKS